MTAGAIAFGIVIATKTVAKIREKVGLHVSITKIGLEPAWLLATFGDPNAVRQQVLVLFDCWDLPIDLTLFLV